MGLPPTVVYFNDGLASKYHTQLVPTMINKCDIMKSLDIEYQ